MFAAFQEGQSDSRFSFAALPTGESNWGSGRLRSVPKRSAASDRVSEPGLNNYTPSFITKIDTHSVTLEEDLSLKLLTDRGTSEVLEREKQIAFG